MTEGKGKHCWEYWETQVGPPVACNNIKLADVPDMEYFSARGQGEVFSSVEILHEVLHIWLSWPGRGICFIFSSVEILYPVFHIWFSVAARDIATRKLPRCTTLKHVWQVCVIGSNVFQGYFRWDTTVQQCTRQMKSFLQEDWVPPTFPVQ